MDPGSFEPEKLLKFMNNVYLTPNSQVNVQLPIQFSRPSLPEHTLLRREFKILNRSLPPPTIVGDENDNNNSGHRQYASALSAEIFRPHRFTAWNAASMTCPSTLECARSGNTRG